MDCRGLVDPRNKPFGRVLPLEVQIKIMFWVECFYTMDRRKKVVREFNRLPKCDLSGYPKVLGDYYAWNQVVTRLNTPRRISCHHCHRLIEHRLSVSEKRVSNLLLLLMTLTSIFFFSDWHDVGNGAATHQPRPPDE